VLESTLELLAALPSGDDRDSSGCDARDAASPERYRDRLPAREVRAPMIAPGPAVQDAHEEEVATDGEPADVRRLG
jgi:hypothetical protein